MERNNFWNEAAKCGAVLGCLLAASQVIESLISTSGQKGLYGVMIVEWIVVVVLHFRMLLRFTRSRAALCTPAEGFTFGQGYGCVMAASAFAGVIVGLVQAIYLHLIVGYSNYIERSINAITRLLSENADQIPAALASTLAQQFEQMRAMPTPSVLGTVWSGLFSTLLFGAFFGLFIASMTARQPRPFDAEPEDNSVK